MPVHDWTKVEAGIFHDFHQSWIIEIKRSLNDDLLPSGYYALSEQITSDFVPDVLTLQAGNSNGQHPSNSSTGVQFLTLQLPKTSFHSQSEAGKYLNKSKVIKIRHSSDHTVVAVIEILSPGNKANQRDFDALIEKTQSMLQQGIHLLVIDLFPPSKRDPQGIHQAIWEGFDETEFELPASKPLVLASYKAGYVRESFVEPFAVGDTLIDMPVFLSDNEYVSLPLEQTYGKAWELVPAYWRDVISQS